jgi:hypothetical protein
MHVSENKGPRNLQAVVHAPVRLAQEARGLDGHPRIIADHVRRDLAYSLPFKFGKQQ